MSFVGALARLNYGMKHTENRIRAFGSGDDKTASLARAQSQTARNGHMLGEGHAGHQINRFLADQFSIFRSRLRRGWGFWGGVCSSAFTVYLRVRHSRGSQAKDRLEPRWPTGGCANLLAHGVQHRMAIGVRRS